MKTAVVLTIAVLANSIGNLLLSIGMQDFPAPEGSATEWVTSAASHVVSNSWMITGVILLIVFLSSYLMALSWADLSFVLPATAPAYILTVVLATIFLDETISPARWAGTMLIVAGTFLVARSYKPPTASVSPEAQPRNTQPAGRISR